MSPFDITLEVVPPAGWDAEPLLRRLEGINNLGFSGFSVATNPVAKPRMDALSLCRILQDRFHKPTTLHITTRDHNRLSLQGMLWGARALGIESVLAMTGDYVPLAEKGRTSAVRDISLSHLIQMCREAGFHTGVVMNPFTDEARLATSISRLQEKVDAGAQFVVTQPVYTHSDAQILASSLAPLKLPSILGILPLRTARHAQFLHEKVGGIEVPEEVQAAMMATHTPTEFGNQLAFDLLQFARNHFQGACIMPPFDHFEVMEKILGRSPSHASS
ncbi:MAG: methylenetetrahydrofolate reductase [Desulfobacterales bacterium]|nr:methylenetetrahydrofolate reductase [Desulfobacterales bacterium]